MKASQVAAVAAMITVAVEALFTLAGAVTDTVPALGLYALFCLATAFVAGLLAALAALLAVALARLARRLARAAAGGSAALATGPDRVAWLHGGATFAALFAVGVAAGSARIIPLFHDPGLIGLVIALFALVWAGLSGGVALALVAGLRGRRLLGGRLAAGDPLTSLPAALVVWIAIGWAAILVAVLSWPEFAIVFSARLALAVTLFVLLLLDGRQIAALVVEPTGWPRRAFVAALAVIAALALPAMLLVRDSDVRRVASHSPAIDEILAVVRAATDWDGDGFGWLFGEGDCAPLDATIHPGARDLPGDDIDQNCTGSDFVPGARPSPVADTRLPAALIRPDYSFLLITIDTVRYDHTSGGGNRHATTPNLDRLAARQGAWFERFYSSGSLTKDVMPTLITSQHMDELPLGPPIAPGLQNPRVLGDSARTMAEVFRDAGYHTGMFTGFYYFSRWGLEQGMEEHVNLAGEMPGAGGSTEAQSYRLAPVLTDRAIAWLETLHAGERPDAPEGRNAGASPRWFLWIHYFEPHYPYIDHPGLEPFGTSEADRYDGEIRFIDREIGRWLEWIDGDPVRAGRTVVAVTSDHGEELGERGRHGHGGGLWNYLIHIPLVIAVPGLRPVRVATPGSILDIAPTLAAIAGVAPDPSWTGRALVAEITGQGGPGDRIVFAAERHTRTYAAISAGFKLLRDDYRNLEQLVDLAGDPGERSDARQDSAEMQRRLHAALIDWRERVVGAELP